MPFLDTNSHLTTKPYNFDIKCPSNSESYDQHGFFGTKFRGSQDFLLTVGNLYNEREYSGADWLVPLVCLQDKRKLGWILSVYLFGLNLFFFSGFPLSCQCVRGQQTQPGNTHTSCRARNSIRAFVDQTNLNDLCMFTTSFKCCCLLSIALL